VHGSTLCRAKTQLDNGPMRAGRVRERDAPLAHTDLQSKVVAAWCGTVKFGLI